MDDNSITKLTKFTSSKHLCIITIQYFNYGTNSYHMTTQYTHNINITI